MLKNCPSRDSDITTLRVRWPLQIDSGPCAAAYGTCGLRHHGVSRLLVDTRWRPRRLMRQVVALAPMAAARWPISASSTP
jgi:hypothetical protein